MKFFHLLWICTAVAAVGCGRSDADREAFQKAMQSSREAASAAAHAPAATAAPAPIKLTETAVKDMGVSLDLPEGSKILAASKLSTTYSYPLKGGLFEINVQILGSTEKTLDKAKGMATALGDKVLEANEKDGTIEIVNQPTGPLQTVYMFGATRTAKCNGPAKQLDVLKEICRSMKATP